MAKTHTPRPENYDMQRNVTASFSPVPSPLPVSGNRIEPVDISNDPIVDHIRGIRDTTPARG